MKDEVRALIQKGLHEENLVRLTRLCRTLFADAPSLYGTLIYIFESFAQEYDNQGIPMARYELIIKSIQQPLLMLLQDENDPAVFVHRLDEVFRAFEALKEDHSN